MKVAILLSILSLVSGASFNKEKTPTFALLDNDRSANDIPKIGIKFPNGVSDSLVLKRFDAGNDLSASDSKVGVICC